MSTQKTRPVADVLVGADWLERHLDDPTVVVVEVDVSPAAYDAGHIPGATLWNIYADIKDEGYRPRAPAAVEELVRRSGITEESIVVFYGYAPALGLWWMHLLGHTRARVLDLDRDAWLAQGRPWTRRPSTPVRSGYRVQAVSPEIRAERAEVAAAVGTSGELILDVRSIDEYVGERFWPSGGIPEAGRAGRIPSAVHAPADGLTHSDGSFRDPAELAELFPAHHGRRITTYCTIGARAATVWLVLTHLLGYEQVRVYDGSWTEWGMRGTRRSIRGHRAALRRAAGWARSARCPVLRVVGSRAAHRPAGSRRRFPRRRGHV